MTLRNIAANKLFSFIHIIGLSIGLAACFIMLVIVIHEYSYDKHHEKLDNIYRVYSYSPVSDKNWYAVPIPLNNYIKENIPEVEKSARVLRSAILVSIPGIENAFEETKAYCVDEELFDILTIPIITKAKNELLSDPNSILISRSIAQKYFGSEDPLGKVLSVTPRSLKDESNFVVTGVFEDFPFTSTLKADFLLPMEYGEELILKRYAFRKEFTRQSWLMTTGLEILILKNDNVSAENLSLKMPKYSDFVEDERNEYEYRIESYSSVHLNGSYANWNPHSVNKSTIKLFSGIAILILVIACFNFIIMSISKYTNKSKDVGIRKVLGAGKRNITLHILTESLVYALLSFPLTIILIHLFHSNITEFLNIELADYYYFSSELILIFIALTLGVGLISGLYSTYKLSRLSPLSTISFKKSMQTRRVKSVPVFVFIQMVVFISLVFSSIIIQQQTDYFKKSDLGFSQDNILIIEIDDLSSTKYRSLKAELKNSAFVTNVSGATVLPPALGGGLLNVSRKGEPSTIISINALGIDFDFLETLEIPLIKGRSFNKKFSRDSVSSIIANKTAAKAINVNVGDLIMDRQIVGIVEDFKFRSLREEVPPLLMDIVKPKYIGEIAVKYLPNSETETIDYIQKVWSNFGSDQPLTFYYMNDKFNGVYKSDYNFATLINISSLLAIFISCLGLFGFTVFNTQQRIKEIGIRRVLGASLMNILSLFVKRFLWVIIIASIFGLLVGNYLVNQWLNNFVYRIDITFLDLIFTLILCSAITIITISIYVVKTVLSNPANSLRYE